MSYVVLPDELERKADIVESYRKGFEFLPNTPDYVKEYAKEVHNYYEEASNYPDGRPSL